MKRLRARWDAYQPSGIEGAIIFMVIGLAGMVAIVIGAGSR